MFTKYSYPDEFEHLMLDLKDKYPKSILMFEGIHPDQLDTVKSEKHYRSKSNTSDFSVDANSNVQMKLAGAFFSEKYKSHDRQNSLYLLWRTARKLYGTRKANDLVEKEVCKDLNIQDFSLFSMPYCFAYDCYDLVTQGLPFITNKPSEPAKHADTILRHAEQLVMFASRNTLGATAIPNVLIMYSALLKDDSENDDYPVFNWKTHKYMFEKYVRQEFKKFVFTLNQPIRDFQCVTEDTEVLTPQGFKSHNDLKVGDDIYTWNNGNLNIQKVKRVNVKEYEGDMIEFVGRDINQTVTPNHRVLYKKFNTDQYEIKDAEELYKFKTPIDIPIAFKGVLNDVDYDISDELLKLTTIIFCDGTFRKEVGKSTRISISKSPLREGQEEIEYLLDNLNYNYHSSNRITTFENANGVEGYEDKEYAIKIYTINVDSSKEINGLLSETKKILPDWIFKLSKRQANIVLNTWMRYDGYGDPDEKGEKIKLQCDNYDIADQVQHLATIAGYGSRITERHIANNKKPTLYVYLYKRQNKSATQKNKIYYKGKVWCPTTDDGIVVYRKDGRIFISGNSPFTNITLFDKKFMEEATKLYIINGKSIDVDFAMYIQELFMKCMNEFNKRYSIFTFPVLTAQIKIDENNEVEDNEFFDKVCEYNLEFANYNIFPAKELTMLSACCRLLSNVEDIIQATKEENMNLIGGSTVKVGSFGVTTINLPRLGFLYKDNEEEFFNKLEELAKDSYIINHCRRNLIQEHIDAGEMPLYTYNFIDLKNQYSTLGIVGLYECLYYLGYDIQSDKGQTKTLEILNKLEDISKHAIEKYGYRCNIEQIPAEATSYKLVEVDKILYKKEEFKLYSNQFIPLTNDVDILDRIQLQSKFDRKFSGGNIMHLNVGEKIESVEKMKSLIKFIIKKDVQYFAINYFFSLCNNNHYTVTTGEVCPECGEDIKERYTRVVGFLTPVSSWHEVRRDEFYERKKYTNGSLEVGNNYNDNVLYEDKSCEKLKDYNKIEAIACKNN